MKSSSNDLLSTAEGGFPLKPLSGMRPDDKLDDPEAGADDGFPIGANPPNIQC